MRTASVRQTKGREEKEDVIGACEKSEAVIRISQQLRDPQ